MGYQNVHNQLRLNKSKLVGHVVKSEKSSPTKIDLIFMAREV